MFRGVRFGMEWPTYTHIKEKYCNLILNCHAGLPGRNRIFHFSVAHDTYILQRWVIRPIKNSKHQKQRVATINNKNVDK